MSINAVTQAPKPQAPKSSPPQGQATQANAGVEEPHVIHAMQVCNEVDNVGQKAQPKNQSIFGAQDDQSKPVNIFNVD